MSDTSQPTAHQSTEDTSSEIAATPSTTGDLPVATEAVPPQLTTPVTTTVVAEPPFEDVAFAPPTWTEHPAVELAGTHDEPIPEMVPEPFDANAITQRPASAQDNVLRGPAFGPTGKHRSIFAIVTLSIITLGIYSFVWIKKISNEMSDFDPRLHVRAGKTTWAMVLPYLLTVGVTLAEVARIVAHQLGYSITLNYGVALTYDRTLLAIGALLVTQYVALFFPPSVIATVMTSERVRVIEDHVGISSDRQLRPVANVWWLLFPLLGPLVLMARPQRRLNKVWEMVEDAQHRQLHS